MPTNRFNEAEAYLLQNWGQACKVEGSIKKIRKKYAEIADVVLASIQERYEGLDRCENNVKNIGSILIGCERWQTAGNYAWIGAEYLNLENLSGSDSERPFIGVYTGELKKPAMNVEQLRHVVSKATAILTEDQLAECGEEEDTLYHADDVSDCVYQYQLYYSLPDKRELLNMLLDGDGQRFVDCLVEHFQVFAKFIPVLDEIYSEPTKK